MNNMNKKKIIIVVSFVSFVLALVVVLGILARQKSMDQKKERIPLKGATKEQQARTAKFIRVTKTAVSELDPNLCDVLESEFSKTACLDEANKQLALASGEASYCTKMSRNTDADLCVYQVAVDTKNKATCTLITNINMQTSCTEKVTAIGALKSSSVEDCFSITKNEFVRKDCLINIFSNFESLNECDIIDASVRQFCQDILLVREMYIRDDVSACSGIIDEEVRGYCDGSGEYFVNFKQKFDKDGDGLRTWQEKLLGTDETKKDTDGDGYDDYTELVNGYDPTGPGKKYDVVKELPEILKNLELD